MIPQIIPKAVTPGRELIQFAKFMFKILSVLWWIFRIVITD